MPFFRLPTILLPFAVALAFLCTLLPHPVTAADEATLLQTAAAMLGPVRGDNLTFALCLRGQVLARQTSLADLANPRVGDPGVATAGAAVTAELTLARTGSHTGFIKVDSPWLQVEVHRTADETRLVLPRHHLVFVGQGSATANPDSLDPAGFMGRLITTETSVAGPYTVLTLGPVETGLRQLMLPHLRPASGDAPTHCWTFGKGHQLSAVPASGATPWTLSCRLGSGTTIIKDLNTFTLAIDTQPRELPVIDPALRREPVERALLERLIMRGLRRLLSIQLPGPDVSALPAARAVTHGELRHHDGQALALLWGTPEQMGTAHGQLLGPQVRRTLDSTYYLVGLVETIEKGRWFPAVLEDAWKRLSPHIPADHVREMAALASATPGITAREMQLSNVFPEYFHCSGFAVYGRATKGGTLYHGRVLDYMTQIGLQQAAATFVVKPAGKAAFANVGYAGFIGSVGGMNEHQISVGEMGGGGRFQWDGVPMATLMRRALEECRTLDEVKGLWSGNPRTCEYYYVFTDGKGPSAVGVKATPQALEFLGPGEPHPLLGEGIADTVVMSAGSRLKTLRQRICDQHGTLDASAAIRLMDRPVAMRSNLHDALFVPAEMVFYRAEASHERPAAENPYVRYDLAALLRELAPRR